MAPAFKTINGRLHKLINGRYVQQDDNQIWKWIEKGYQENPGALGILDPRVWGAMPNTKKNISTLGTNQKPKNIPPINQSSTVTQNPLYDDKGRNVFDGTTLKGENERKAELISNANKTSLASKVNSEETNNSTDTIVRIPKESNFVRWGRMQSQSKGSSAKNAALLADMRAAQQTPSTITQQASSAINDKGNPVPTKEVKTEIVKSSITNDKFKIPEVSTQNFWNKNIPINNFKEGIKSGAMFSEIPKNIDLSGQALNPANMAKDMQSGISFAEGAEMNPLGEAGGITGAAALKIGSMILGALSKKKGGGGYVKEGGGGDISKVPVPAGIDPEQFYAMV